MSISETTTMESWQKSGWRVMPYNFVDVVVDPPASGTGLKGWEPQRSVWVGGFELTEPGSEEEQRWQGRYRYGEERAHSQGFQEEDIERLVDNRRS